MIHRGQLLVWDMGRETPVSQSSETCHNFAGVGIIDVDEGTHLEHVMRSFIAQGTTLWFTDHSQDVSHEVRAHDIGNTITNWIWPRPAKDAALAGGGIYCRRTRAKTEAGREILLICLSGSLPSSGLRHNHLYEVTGKIGGWDSNGDHFTRSQSLNGFLEINNPRNLSDMIEKGLSMAQLLKQPLWGWSAEKFGFVSTMDLQTIDACAHYSSLIAIENPTEEQTAEIESLRFTDAGQILSAQRNDEMYNQFRREMGAQFGPICWDGTITEAEEMIRSEYADKIIRNLMQIP